MNPKASLFFTLSKEPLEKASSFTKKYGFFFRLLMSIILVFTLFLGTMSPLFRVHSLSASAEVQGFSEEEQEVKEQLRRTLSKFGFSEEKIKAVFAQKLGISLRVYWKTKREFAAKILDKVEETAAFLEERRAEEKEAQTELEKLFSRKLTLKNTTHLFHLAFTLRLSEAEYLKLKTAVLPKLLFTELSYPILPRPTQYGKRRSKRSSLEEIKSYRGQGQVVAVIDSGFDVDHPDMMIKEKEKEKYKTAEQVAEITKKYSLPGKWYNDKFPYGYNYATPEKEFDLFEAGISHGTHVAGIAAANGEKMQGQAPEAQVLALRVFPDEPNSGTQPDLYNLALEHAVLLGATTVNMSLGTPFGLLADASQGTVEAINKARNAGVNVSISAGNSGYLNIDIGAPRADAPAYETIAEPSLLGKSISVASLNESQMVASLMQSTSLSYEVANSKARNQETLADLQDFPYQAEDPAKLQAFFAHDSFYPLAYAGLAREEDVEDLDLQGKIALIERGEITFVEKIHHVEEKGAVLAVIYNSEKGGNNFFEMNVEGTTIPALALFRNTGLALKAGLEKAQASGEGEGRQLETQEIKPILSLRLTERENRFSYEEGNQLSDFSSWGPTPEFDLKPEITAVGGNVYSTLPGGKHGNLSGTSMAAPQITGLLALLHQRMEKTEGLTDLQGSEKALFMKNLLMSTALPQSKNGVYVSPRKQGAGLANKDQLLSSWAYVTSAQEQPGPQVVDPSIYGDDTDDTSVGNNGEENTSEGNIGEESGSVAEGNTASGSLDDEHTGESTPDTKQGGIEPGLLAKVNLGALGKQAIHFDLKIHNFSSTETLHFTPETYVLTDKPNPNQPHYLLPGESQLLGTIQGTEISVAPQGENTLHIELPSHLWGDALLASFPRGYFVEGFVRLKSSRPELQPDIGLPFIGYYGPSKENGEPTGFGAQEVLEKPIYEFGQNGLITADTEVLPTYYKMKNSTETHPFTSLMSEMKGRKVVLGDKANAQYLVEEILDDSNGITFSGSAHHEEEGFSSNAELSEEVPEREFSKEEIVISPNDDGIYEVAYFVGNFINDYVKAGFTVENAEGEEVYHGNDVAQSSNSFGHRNYFDSAFSGNGRDTRVTSDVNWRWEGREQSEDYFSTSKALPDGLYTFVFHARGIAPGAPEQKVRIPLRIDTTAPSITETEKVAYTSTEEDAREDSRFTGKVLEEGSGVLYAQVQRVRAANEEGQENDIQVLEVDEEGRISFTYEESHAADYFVTIIDKAGNTLKRSLPILYLNNAYGSPNLTFLVYADDGSDEVDEEGQVIPREVPESDIPYRMEVFSEAGVKQQEVKYLPYGHYYAELHMDSSAYTLEETRYEFTITEAEPNPELRIPVTEHTTQQLFVSLRYLPNYSTFDGKRLSLVAINKESHEEFPLTIHSLNDIYGGANAYLTAGEWTITSKELEEGWHLYPQSIDIHVEKDKEIRSLAFSVFQQAGSFVPVTTIHDSSGKLQPEAIQYEALQDIYYREGLENIPVGHYTIKPQSLPEGYYVVPNFLETDLLEGQTQEVHFDFYPIEETSYGSVEVTEENSAKQQGLRDAIESVYVAEDIFGHRVEDLSHIPYGTWSIYPAKYDYRFDYLPKDFLITLSPDAPKASVHFSWSSLAKSGKKNMVVATTAWEDEGSYDYEEDNSRYVFSFENLETGERFIPETIRTIGENHFMPDIPYGFYAVRPILPENKKEEYRVWPEFQFVRVSDVGKGRNVVLPEFFTYAKYGKAPVSLDFEEQNQIASLGKVEEVSTSEILLKHRVEQDLSNVIERSEDWAKLPFLHLAATPRVKTYYYSYISSEEEQPSQNYGLNLEVKPLKDRDGTIMTGLIENLVSREAQLQSLLTAQPSYLSKDTAELVYEDKKVSIHAQAWDFHLTQTSLDGDRRVLHQLEDENEGLQSKFPAYIYIPLDEKAQRAFQNHRLQVFGLQRSLVEREEEALSYARDKSLYLGTVEAAEAILQVRLGKGESSTGEEQSYLVVPVHHFSEYRLVYWSLAGEDTVSPHLVGSEPNLFAGESTGVYSGPWAEYFLKLDEHLRSLFTLFKEDKKITLASYDKKQKNKVEKGEKDKVPATSASFHTRLQSTYPLSFFKETEGRFLLWILCVSFLSFLFLGLQQKGKSKKQR